jgi:hypothetical protein
MERDLKGAAAIPNLNEKMAWTGYLSPFWNCLPSFKMVL